MAKESSGCFAWVISLKRSCNERWARFRNRFRQRFYARRGQTVDPTTVLNETGTSDMVISKTPYKSNKIVPLNQAVMAVQKDDLGVTDEHAPTADADNDFDKLVGEFVSCIINSAADALKQTSLSNTVVVIENVADDNVSLSSSIISQMADTAVTESLTNILTEADINHSASHYARSKPRDAFEVVCGDVVDDGLY
ncbi:uncharacterized protein LOC123537765 [Mercenaria mercenaria]|uniref:uncharacterized protein LOC123537765 n=1 Tax=Mercenaria mercenaria TaxID=6596 RepID=UPI00234EE0C2|nr:uncharacterized protein LOC123537765 [Mercenaria mercenaria]